MTAQKMSAQEIIAFIGNAEKKTNVKVTFEGELATAVPASVTKLGNVLFGDWKDIEPLLANLTENKDYVVEQDGRNSAVPLLDKRYLNARIEPGAIIRDQVTIEDNAVVMMGAVINIGAEIGAGTPYSSPASQYQRFRCALRFRKECPPRGPHRQEYRATALCPYPTFRRFACV